MNTFGHRAPKEPEEINTARSTFRLSGNLILQKHIPIPRTRRILLHSLSVGGCFLFSRRTSRTSPASPTHEHRAPTRSINKNTSLKEAPKLVRRKLIIRKVLPCVFCKKPSSTKCLEFSGNFFPSIGFKYSARNKGP